MDANYSYKLDEKTEKIFEQNLKEGVFKTLRAEGLLTEQQFSQLLNNNSRRTPT